MHIIWNLGYWKVCAWWVSRSLAVEHTTERNGIYPEFLARFEAEEESFLSRIVIADGSIILNRMRKDNPWKSTALKKKGSLSAGKVIITGTVKKRFLWMRCQKGRQSTPRFTSGRWQNSEAFRTTSAWQDSKRNLASARQHTNFEEEWGSHNKICLGSVNTSTLQPRSTTLIFQPIWSPEGCNSRYKFWN